MNSIQQCMEKLNTYTARVDREHPTAFVFLIDRSGSMSNSINLNGEQVAKDKIVADAINKTLEEIINRCTKTDEIRHYFDISLIGYGCDSDAQFIAIADKQPTKWLTPDELKKTAKYKTITQTINIRGAQQQITKQEPYWIEPVSKNRTPMHQAITMAHELLDEWCQRHMGEDCYPPVVINITDGAQTDATDQQMVDVAKKLKSLTTIDGNIIMFNIHLSGDNQVDSIAFPTDINQLPDSSYSKMLYEMSSTLPVSYNKEIAAMKKTTTNAQFRAMGLNTRADFVQMLNIGTITNLATDE